MLAIIRSDSVGKAIGMGLLCLALHAVFVVTLLRLNRVGIGKEGLILGGQSISWASIRSARYVSTFLFRGL